MKRLLRTYEYEEAISALEMVAEVASDVFKIGS